MIRPPTYERLRARRGAKWTRYGPDVLAAWVADMDFDPPTVVTDTMRALIDDNDLGYNLGLATELPEAYADWQERHHGWRPDETLIRPFTGTLHALETALWHRSAPGDGVVVLTPIYYPFLHAIADSRRRLVDVPLDPVGWRLDPERLAAAIDPTTRMILFCQPHNPVGRVFDADEIAAVADVAERHDLLVVTDEIWGDLTLGTPHRPLASADERLHGRLVTIGSVSKAFNLAGLRCGVAHIDDDRLNDAMATMPGHLLGASATTSTAGTLAAWRSGDEWLAAVRAELVARRDQLAARLSADLPEVAMTIPEATYFGWLDFRATGLGDDPAKRLLTDAKVALSSGLPFGEQGAGFARINFATSAEILDDIIDRIVTLVRSTP